MSKPEEFVIRFNRWKVIPPALMCIAFLTPSMLILNTIEPGMPWHWKTYAPKHPMTKFEYAVLVVLFGACALVAAALLLVFLKKFWRGVALSLGPEGMRDDTGALHKFIRWADLARIIHQPGYSGSANVA